MYQSTCCEAIVSTLLQLPQMHDLHVSSRALAAQTRNVLEGLVDEVLRCSKTLQFDFGFGGWTVTPYKQVRFSSPAVHSQVSLMRTLNLAAQSHTSWATALPINPGMHGPYAGF